VVLNACQSGRPSPQLTGGFACAFLMAGAGTFVGALWSVIDEPAYIFLKALYGALLDDKPLGEAAKIARNASAEKEASSWLAYAVYGDLMRGWSASSIFTRRLTLHRVAADPVRWRAFARGEVESSRQYKWNGQSMTRYFRLWPEGVDTASGKQ
jgi:CHAT domain-containing protein